jgi:SAM-dependent methyltransferase
MTDELAALVSTVADAVAQAGGPDSGWLEERLRARLAEADVRGVDGIDPDRLGDAHQQSVDGATRAAVGQFYTPPWVAAVLAEWAVRDADDRVLDPCCGAGAITARLADRYADLGLDHEDAMARTTAVDRDPVALGLCGLSLAARDESRAVPELRAVDFFDLSLADVGPFDATVANPPYVRQEAIAGDRERYREHLRGFGPPDETPYYDGEAALDGRCDLYCYFLTRATAALADGGRLAWVVPTKWLVADYGASLRRFLRDHYRLHAVVGSRTREFDGPLVDTVLVLAERRVDDATREPGTTHFVRLTRRVSVRDVLAAVGDPSQEPPVPGGDVRVRTAGTHRTVTVPPAATTNGGDRRTGHYLTAPSLYLRARAHAGTVPLERLADVSRGKKTGANAIFVLTDDDVAEFGIDERFCRPAVKSVREVVGYRHGPGDASRWFLDVHDYVTAVRTEADGEGRSLEALVRESLRADGYDGLLSYLEWAEDRPPRSNASLSANDPWFDMGPVETAPVVCPQAMDTRRFFARCDGVAPSNRFLLVAPEACDETLLLGLLNASLTQVAVESHGRVTGGGAVNLAASDLRTLPVPDPDGLTPARASAVRDGFRQLEGGDEDGRRRIDRAVGSALDLDATPADLAAVSAHLKAARRKDGAAVSDHLDAIDAIERRIVPRERR